MASLNKKNGSLRGVSLQYAPLDEKTGERDYAVDWSTGIPVQGWPVFNNKKHRFDITFSVGDFDMEILLTTEALENMIEAIRANQKPIKISGCKVCGGEE